MDKGFPEFVTSPLLLSAGFRHAFFTRRGGVSVGPYASLSFSLAVGDEPAHVNENLGRAANALGVDVARMHFLSQVHGRDAIVTSSADDRTALVTREGDAVVSRDPKCAASVRIADCVPILVADRTSGAACAVHAGWRGLAGGVIESSVEALRGVAGGVGDLVAAIGPHITVTAFEVSEDVAATLQALAPDEAVVDRSFGPKPHVDLARIALVKLRALGLAPGAVDVVPGCTHGDRDRFFSFRRDGKTSGRHLAAIVPR